MEEKGGVDAKLNEGQSGNGEKDHKTRQKPEKKGARRRGGGKKGGKLLFLIHPHFGNGEGEAREKGVATRGSTLVNKRMNFAKITERRGRTGEGENWWGGQPSLVEKNHLKQGKN